MRGISHFKISVLPFRLSTRLCYDAYIPFDEMPHPISTSSRATITPLTELHRAYQGSGARQLHHRFIHQLTSDPPYTSEAGFMSRELQLFQKHDTMLDEFTISKHLTTASNLVALDEGKQLHALILKKNLYMDVAAMNSLINFYFKCGSIADAQMVFDGMPERDVYSWTVMVSGYAVKGCVSAALDLFQIMPLRNTVSWNSIITLCQREGFDAWAVKLFVRMMREGWAPNSLTFLAIIKAYTTLQLLEGGKGVHCSVVKSAWLENDLVGSTLVDMYGKCGDMLDARRAFDDILEKNVVLWTILLAGYAQNGMISEAEKVFREMPEKNVVSWNVFIVGLVQTGMQYRACDLVADMFSNGVRPNSCTVTSLLSGCSSSQYMKEGKILHGYAVKVDLLSYTSVCNSVITMYGEQGNINDARRIFDQIQCYDVISWTAMLAAYVADDDVMGARDIFDRMPEKNLISWNTMLFGYLQIGRSLEANSLRNIRISTDLVDYALTFFYEMVRSESKPDHFSYNCALTACGCSRALVQARAIHGGALKRGFESDVGVGNALITAYGKCGDLGEAESVFKILSAPDIISWNALLMAYAQNGEGDKALNLFDEMRSSGVELNHVSFIILFSACSYSGDVKKGQEYFNMMQKDYGIIPIKEHYACIVDLLGKAGLLCDAEAIINIMPMEPDVTVWGALLGACKMHGDPLIGKRAAEQILLLEPDNVATHIAMAETFAAKCMWRDVENVWASMRKNGLLKEPGCSWIDIRNQKHEFLSGDNRHLQKDSIYESLWTVYCNIIEERNISNFDIIKPT